MVTLIKKITLALAINLNSFSHQYCGAFFLSSCLECTSAEMSSDKTEQYHNIFLNAVRSVVGDGAHMNHTAHPSDESCLGGNA